MASVILAGTTSTTALNLTGDTSGELQLKTNNGSTTAMTLTTAGNVGIGTASPSVGKLVVKLSSTGSTNGLAIVSSANDTFLSIYNNGSVHNIEATYSSTGSFQPIAFVLSSAERMRIGTDGNVGIGTASPSFPLDISAASGTTARIKSTGNYSYLRLDTTSTTGGGGLTCWQNGSQKALFGVTGSILGDTSGDAGVYAETGQGVRFYSNATERMRITSSGNLLVGTTTTRNRLTVASSASAVAPTLGTASGTVMFTNDDTTYGMMIGSSGGGQSWVQVQRVDSVATAYDLWLQPSGGNVCIGTTLANAKFNVESNGGQMRLRNTTQRYRSDFSVGASGGLNINAYDDTGGVYQTVALDGNPIGFNISGSERARFDSSGRLLLNGTSATSNTYVQVNVNGGNGAQGWMAVMCNGSNLANQQAGVYLARTNNYIQSTIDGSGNFRDNVVAVAGASGGVQLTSGATSWSALSDERTKDIIEPITDATNKVSTLRAVIGKYKNDLNDKRRAFLIAQDVQAVLPEAVVTEDKGQETEKLLLSYTDVIPLLVAAIKEQQAIITDLKQRIETLEAK